MNDAPTSAAPQPRSPDAEATLRDHARRGQGTAGRPRRLLLLAGVGYYLIFQGFDTTARILTAAGILLVGIAIAIDPRRSGAS